MVCLDSCGSVESSHKKDVMSKRKDDNAFLQHGFTTGYNNGAEKPLCFICNETLSAESMKPS